MLNQLTRASVGHRLGIAPLLPAGKFGKVRQMQVTCGCFHIVFTHMCYNDCSFSAETTEV